MAKRKKTRQQKIASDFRRKQNELLEESLSRVSPPASFMYQAKIQQQAVIKAKPPTTLSYSYLRADLLKTSFLTLALILTQLLLFFLLKNHIINLPMLRY